jgi:hypothetical protein
MTFQPHCTEALSTTFMAIAEYALATGAAPIKDKLWHVKLDKSWEFVVNGFMEEKETGPFGQSRCSHKIGPAECYIEFNGWPAGIINPYRGSFAAGELANEQTFCEALKRGRAA